jgi:hypothetical protein
MRPTWKRFLNVGLVLVGSFTATGRCAEPASRKTSLTITVRVLNFAGVNQKMIAVGEKVAAGIFAKSGVEIRWIDTNSTMDDTQANSDAEQVLSLSHIHLKLLTSEKFGRLGLPSDAMGLAPGSGPDRQVVYISYSRVETLYSEEMDAQLCGRLNQIASDGQILGHVIAHELGHILLNQTVHSPEGIMRGVWNFIDLKNVSYGDLLFSPEQGKILRAEVLRRIAQQEAPAVASTEVGSLIR